MHPPDTAQLSNSPTNNPLESVIIKNTVTDSIYRHTLEKNRQNCQSRTLKSS